MKRLSAGFSITDEGGPGLAQLCPAAALFGPPLERIGLPANGQRSAPQYIDRISSRCTPLAAKRERLKAATHPNSDVIDKQNVTLNTFYAFARLIAAHDWRGGPSAV